MGAFAAFFVLRYLAPLNPSLKREDIPGFFVTCYIAGYLGARTLSIVVEQSPESLGQFFTMLLSLGPMTFYGGAIGSFIAGSVYAKLKGMRLGEVVDMAIPAGLMGLFLGRIGCFLNGDDYGKVTAAQGSDAPFYAVVFPNLQDGMHRYPVQIFSSLAALAIALYFISRFPRLRASLPPGHIGVLAIMAYAVGRFLLEFMRGDPRGSLFAGLLSTSQFIALLTFCLSALYLLVAKNRQAKNP